MLEDASIGVVVVAFNEEGLVGDVIETVPEFVDRIYAIDDDSTDDTWLEIQAATEQVNRAPDRREVVAFRNETNRGVGGAIKRGYTAAVSDDIDVIVVMAGDGQMDPAVLDRIATPVIRGEVDYAKGNRLHRRADRSGMSRWRFFGNSLLTMLTRVSSGYWQLTDPQNGYTAISREALQRIPYEEAYDRYGFANELLVLLNAHRLRIADVSHPAVYGDERSNIEYRSFVPNLSMLLLRRFLWRIKTRYIVRGFNPLSICYPVGVVGVFAGVVAGAIAALGYAGSAFSGAVGSLLLTMVGGLWLTLAVWFDVTDNEGLVVKVESPVAVEPTPITDPTEIVADAEPVRERRPLATITSSDPDDEPVGSQG